MQAYVYVYVMFLVIFLNVYLFYYNEIVSIIHLKLKHVLVYTWKWAKMVIDFW